MVGRVSPRPRNVNEKPTVFASVFDPGEVASNAEIYLRHLREKRPIGIHTKV
jgi:hypothetical protein